MFIHFRTHLDCKSYCKYLQWPYLIIAFIFLKLWTQIIQLKQSTVRQEGAASCYIWRPTAPSAAQVHVTLSPLLWPALHGCPPPGVFTLPNEHRAPLEMVQTASGISSAEAQKGEIMAFCQCSQTWGAMQRPAKSAALCAFHQDNNPKISGIRTKDYPHTCKTCYTSPICMN